MTLEDFAKITFAHLGQSLDSLDANTQESIFFKAVYKHALEKVASTSGASEFSMTFVPALVFERRAEGSPDPEHFVHQYPSNLVKLQGFSSSYRADREFFGYHNNEGSVFDAYYDLLYDARERKRYIISDFNRPKLEGIFVHTEFSFWSPEAIESAALYCAWLLCSQVTKDEQRKARLKVDFNASMSEFKIYDSSNAGGYPIKQRGSWTDIIDFGYTSTVPPFLLR